LGLTKSAKDGPELRVSLKEVLALFGFEGVGAAGGLSEAVAKVRAHCEAVRDRETACRAGTANRQRERGIEAAIVCVCQRNRKRERKRKSKEEREVLGAGAVGLESASQRLRPRLLFPFLAAVSAA
jgi:hypothetical protein